MVASGSIYKLCTCVDESGRRAGVRCPRLRARDGSWSAGHGRWWYRLELPRAQQVRRQLRRRAHMDSLSGAMVEREHARQLLALAGGDPVIEQEIATLLHELPRGEELPTVHELAHRLHSGIPGALTITVGDYLTWWVQHRRIDEHTRLSYASHIRVHLIPHLGEVQLTALTIARVDAMFTAIRARNDQITIARRSTDPTVRDSVRGVRVITAPTMQRIRATLRKALNDAIGKYRLIDHNPAVHVELVVTARPVPREWTDAALAQWRASGFRPSTVMVWTPQQAGRFLDHVEVHDPDLYPLFLLAIIGGPRRGEAVGVRTDEVDVENASVSFSHQIATHGCRPVYKKVKTKNGIRVVALDHATIADLRAYWRRRQGWQQAAGDAWPKVVELEAETPDGPAILGIDLFFRRPDGRAWHPDAVTRRFEQNVRDAGLPPVRFHDARHGSATYTKAAGGDLLDLKHKLGHSSVSVAGDLYPIVLQQLERALAERTAALIPRQRSRVQAGNNRATRLPAEQTPPGVFPAQGWQPQDYVEGAPGEIADKRIPTPKNKRGVGREQVPQPRTRVLFSDAADTDWRSIRGAC